ncbi:MAG: hypothetical protein ABII12_03730 [Planctomycetota bacterium]
MSAQYEVVDVLLLLGTVAPVSFYFLTLGLVNSHARPHIISSQADFLALTCVLMPVLIWPVPMVLKIGSWWPFLLGACAAGVLFAYMLPKAHAGFVLYNISEARCSALLDGALRALRLSGSWDGKTWRGDSGDLVIHVRSFALLRNVTLHVEASDARAKQIAPPLEAELRRRLAPIAQLPSATGAGLVLVGLALMMLPMWMVGRHIDDLVDAMLHLFG